MPLSLAEAESWLASCDLTFTAHFNCIQVNDSQAWPLWTVYEAVEGRGTPGSTLERRINRRFVVKDLIDPLVDGVGPTSEMDAEVHAAIERIGRTRAERLRRALASSFPSMLFEVEEEGLEYVIDEPLEACVTFFQRDDD